MGYILSIDQSTSGTKAVLFTLDGRLVKRADMPHKQIINEKGWVSHDPQEIFSNTLEVCRRCISSAGVDAGEVIGIGISNQRETAVCWDKTTGKPVTDAIVWQCGRAAEIAERLTEHDAEIRKRTGLSNSPYFSAPKWAWILENIPEARSLQKVGNLCCGTIDSWLVYCLTPDHKFLTDYSNASRTELLNLDTLSWDETMAGWFGISVSSLPELRYSDAGFGETNLGGLLPRNVPIAAVMGDSHCALYANGCNQPGMAKATFGTGTSVMMNAGTSRPDEIAPGLVESVAWAAGGKVFYALEGNINFSGALIKWLVNDAGLLKSSRESGELARTVPDTGGVYLVPAFSGLGAPYWRRDARAMLCGMSTATQRAHIVRAAEEAIAYQIKDIVELLRNCGLGDMTTLCVDGGATKDDFLMGFVCDILNIPLMISQTEELSAAGAAFMASVAMGFSKEAELFDTCRHRELKPQMTEQERERLYSGWKQAVSMLLWTEH